MAIDETQLNQFVGRFAGDLGATLHAATVALGDKLGLYRALADGGAQTSAELGERTGYPERYLREWLGAQAASGYCHYDPDTGRFHLDDVQTACLADDSGPYFLAGGMLVATSLAKDEERITEAFRTDTGVPWDDHHHDLFDGTVRFFRPGYVANLVPNWLPALDGVVAKLEAGAKVADIGCGYGASTIIMAEAYPESTFIGYDSHKPSVEAARKAAAQAGVGDRVTFEVATAADFPGTGYDLACMFDALHDMGDPVAAARHIRDALASDGTLLLVEPNAGDQVADNLNPVGRIFYAASTFICVPNARSQDGGWILGAQAGEAQLGEVATQAGFTRFRRATETPFNLVLEARP